MQTGDCGGGTHARILAPVGLLALVLTRDPIKGRLPRDDVVHPHRLFRVEETLNLPPERLDPQLDLFRPGALLLIYVKNLAVHPPLLRRDALASLYLPAPLAILPCHARPDRGFPPRRLAQHCPSRPGKKARERVCALFVDQCGMPTG